MKVFFPDKSRKINFIFTTTEYMRTELKEVFRPKYSNKMELT